MRSTLIAELDLCDEDRSDERRRFSATQVRMGAACSNVRGRVGAWSVRALLTHAPSTPMALAALDEAAHLRCETLLQQSFRAWADGDGHVSATAPWRARAAYAQALGSAELRLAAARLAGHERRARVLYAQLTGSVDASDDASAANASRQEEAMALQQARGPCPHLDSCTRPATLTHISGRYDERPCACGGHWGA